MFRLLEFLFTILFLISVIRTVVSFAQRYFGGIQARARVQQPRPQAQQSATTMLHQDPVCKTYVSVETSLKRLQGGRVIHFCSAECRDRYTA